MSSRSRPKESPSAPSHSHIADPKRSLLARWRQPALSIHKVDVSGPSQKTLIPSWACSSVSIRIVPDQSLLAIVEQLKAHLHRSFASLRTHNSLAVEINHLADWWLGEVESPYFKAMAREVEQEWGIEPLYIREGGSIPSVPFLEREFGVDAVHLPMGTSSDNAHLPDERIRVLNLEVSWDSPGVACLQSRVADDEVAMTVCRKGRRSCPTGWWRWARCRSTQAGFGCCAGARGTLGRQSDVFSSVEGWIANLAVDGSPVHRTPGGRSPVERY